MGTVVHDASSFGFLAPYGPLYLRLATAAKCALAVEPSLTLVSLRQLAEVFAGKPACTSPKPTRAKTRAAAPGSEP